MAWMTKGDEMGTAEQLVPRLRLLRFGLLGGALAHILFLLYPHLLNGRVSLPAAVYLGGLTGVCVFETLVSLFRPLARSAAYYTKSIELEVQKRWGRMDGLTFDRFKAELDERYFLGPGHGKPVPDGLPPGDGR